MTAILEVRGPTGRPAYPLPVSGRIGFAYLLSGLVAALLALTAVSGLLYGRDGLYQADPTLLPQFLGQDALALVFALPLLLVAMRLTWRGSARGLVLWIGVLLYITYWYHFYLDGIPFGPLFLIHIGLVSNSLLAIGVLLARVDVERLRRRFPTDLPVRRFGAVMITLGGLFASVWIADVFLRLGRGAALDGVARSVYVADLTLMLPAMIATGWMLWMRHPWGYVVTGPLLFNAFASMLTLGVTSVLVRLGGIAVSAWQIAGLALAAGLMLACCIAYFRRIRV